MSRLPAGFEDLDHFVDDWVLPDAAARMAKRKASKQTDLQAFYTTMLPRGADVLAYLKTVPMGGIGPADEALLKLMLALAEVAPAVEWYDDPRVTDGFPVERIRYIRQISDTAAQL